MNDIKMKILALKLITCVKKTYIWYEISYKW